MVPLIRSQQEGNSLAAFQVEVVYVEQRSMQYLYRDGEKPFGSKAALAFLQHRLQRFDARPKSLYL